jgi:2-polyprenyl-6-methoxyphenol hydroxylase-like FAD-dependent oxidoreductase
VVRDALIIGGGVGALSAAIALRRRGIEAEVFERAPSLRAGGGGLLLWANALRALRALGLEQEVLDLGAAVEIAEFRAHRGALLTTLPVGDLSRRHGAPSVIVPRGALLTVLAAALPAAAVHFGARCTGFEAFVEDDVATALFADGSARDADVLVAADGLRSTVRAQLRGPESLRETGQVAFVGIAEGCEGALEPGVMVATLGEGQRFWAGALRGGRVYWYAAVKASARVSAEPAEARERLLDLFEGWHTPIEALIGATADAELIRAVIADREPVRRWGEGRLTLLGDAAHPCTPDLGQGACQALESAVVLSRCLGEVDDAEAALRRYEEQRGARTARITQLSWVTAMQSMVESPLACGLRDMGVRTLLRAVAMPELGWILGGSPEAHSASW